MANSQNWITEFFKWTDENHISAEKLPRDEETLLSQTALNLSFCKLTQLPELLGNLTHLTELDLAYNALTEIPEWIDNFTALEKLDVSGNSITSLPDSLRHLPNLEVVGFDKQLLKNTKQGEIMAKRSNLPLLQIRQKQQISQKERNESNAKNNNESEQNNQMGNKKMTYRQKILFGSPGTGKSYKIDQEIIPFDLNIDIEKTPANVVKTVFHPEYTYGDFVGKLMPITTRQNGVEYNFYEGHFLKALGQAYKNIIAAHDKHGNRIDGIEVEKVALVIDEINRGNSAAIFGSIFQLLDREKNGWSSYGVTINGITFNRLLDLIGIEVEKDGKTIKYTMNMKVTHDPRELQEQLKFLDLDLINRTIKIPPNLSILASMNTSDSSIYYMDSAFKRRWEWEFIDVDPEKNVSDEDVPAFETEDKWNEFVKKLNIFIRSKHEFIRGIEDKQIGQRFINFEIEGKIKKSSIKNKLMFFLWDSVFNRDKKPLIDLLFGKDEKHDESPLITFGDFAVLVDEFIDKINNFKNV